MSAVSAIARARTAPRWVIVIAATLLISACDRGPRHPNLLLICVDTVRADLFFEEGVEDALTPWLERGQVHRHATSVAPWTLPSIASVFTGLYPVRHGAGELSGPVHDLNSETPTALSGEALTLAEILADAGFGTGLFSAQPMLKDTFGLNQGFQRQAFRKSPERLRQEMLGWMEEIAQARQPAFAYLHLMGPHDQHRKSRRKLREELGRLDPEVRARLEQHAISGACDEPGSVVCLRGQRYRLALHEARGRIAGLLEDLESRGLLDDTVVVLFSDHGESFGERTGQHRALQTDPRGVYGAGHGQYQFQDLLHVPLVTWIPDAAGTEYSNPVSLVDILPSALHWLGLEEAGDTLALDGAPLPDGRRSGDPNRAVFASHIAYGPESVAVLSGTHKAIYWPGADRMLLFDLEQDAAELRPLEDEGMLLEFTTLVGDYLALPGSFETMQPAVGGDQLRDLQAIGYLQGYDDDDRDEETPDQNTPEAPETTGEETPTP